MTRNTELRMSLLKFSPIAGDWAKLGVLNLALVSLMKSYSMFDNTFLVILSQ